MANENDLNNLPQASGRAAKRLRISVIWIIPILAAVVALGIAIQRITQRRSRPSPLSSRAPQGIEAGKTFIKYKDVTIGQVTTVQLSDDYSKVRSPRRSTKHAADTDGGGCKILGRSSRHVILSGVSGLNTLLSGQYIGFEAGTSENAVAQLHSARRGPGDHGPTWPSIEAHSGNAWIHRASARRFTIAACPSARSRPINSLPTASRSRPPCSSMRRTTSMSRPRRDFGMRAALTSQQGRTALKSGPSRSSRCWWADSHSMCPTFYAPGVRRPRTLNFLFIRLAPLR